MGKYVDAVLNKKPNEFKELVLSGIQERVRTAINAKRVEVGKSFGKTRINESALELKDESDVDLDYHFDEAIDSAKMLLDGSEEITSSDIDEVFDWLLTNAIPEAIKVIKFYKETSAVNGITAIKKDLANVKVVAKREIKTNPTAAIKKVQKSLNQLKSKYNNIRKTLKVDVNSYGG